MTPNEKAFLDMIAVSEGTFGKGDNGYNVLYGGALFHDYTHHPHLPITRKIKGVDVTSTAAGRYQILGKYYEAYKNTLNLADFSPDSQDKIALQMIKEQRALPDVDAGRIDLAIDKCKNIWASLPGAGYHQHENSIEGLKTAFINAGGTVV